jgi:predicted NBD/HSP70 family sugar kinase
MTPMKTCNHKRMKTINTGAILNVLGKSGPMSRVGLTSALGLDGTTITHLVRDLLESKLIEPTGYSKSVIGRPKQFLQLNADGREAIGLQVEPHKISGGLLNLAGNVKAHESIQVSSSDSQDVLLTKLYTVADTLRQKAVKSRLLGMGLATHGIVDKETGTVLQSARLPAWLGVRINDFFKERFKTVPVCEDNSRCKAIAEHWFGGARDIDEFVLLDLGYGIGCAVVSKGRPLTGITNSAGELGHNVVVPDGKGCRCGMRGCLEAMASIPAIEEIFAERFSECGKKSFSDICVLAHQGHQGAVSVLEEAGTYIGIATSSIINVLNPGYLVMSGELLSDDGVIEQAIRKAIEGHAIPASFKALHIERGKLGENDAIIGAAVLVLSNVFISTV